jgi:glycosyltransferase involved in cell wall biosynthesis
MAVQRAGLQVGVLAPSLTSVRPLLRGGWPRSGARTELDDQVPTLRIYQPGWLPPAPALHESLLIRSSLAAFEGYVRSRGRPDLIHAHSLLHGGRVARAILEEFGVPYVLTEHSSAFGTRSIGRRTAREAVGAASKASRCLAVSDALGRTMSEIPGMRCDWLTVPNVLDARFPVSPLERQGNRLPQVFRFKALGALRPIKGFDILIRAFAQAFVHHPPVSIEIGGEGPERESLARLAVDLGVGEQVLFSGPLVRSEVPEWMSAGDAFVVSSRLETFGVVVIEALAMGLPVVATRCGGPEFIVGSDDGVLVPPDDPAALAEALARVRKDHANYDPEALRERCVQRFGEEAVVKQLLEIYREVLGAIQPINSPPSGAEL